MTARCAGVLLAGVVAGASAAEVGDEDDAYDPGAGIDPDGRIAGVDLGAEVAHPERWRYVPEGRIKPGNAFQRFLVSTFIAPIVIAEEDIGAGGGVALTDIDFRGQRRQEFLGLFATYTSAGQQRYAVNWRRWLFHRELPGGGVALPERSWINVQIGYEKTLTRRFFGFGADTAAGDETSYTDAAAHAVVAYQRSLPGPGDDLVVGLALGASRHRLGGGRVADTPDTAEIHPRLFAEADATAAVTLRAGLRYDTRDSQHAPYRGGHLGLALAWSPWQDGFAPGGRATLDGSYVLPVPGIFHAGGDADEEHPPTDVVAVGGFVARSVGALPFFRRPALGGRDTLRGYIGGRWRGDAAWHASLEYRPWLIPRGFGWGQFRIERVGTAVFWDLGSVADDLAGFADAAVHTSLGTGLRLSLERQAQFRFDVAWSAEDTTFSIAYGMAF